MAGEDDVLPIPNLKVAQYYFTLSNPKLAHLHENTGKELLKAIETDGMLYIFIELPDIPLRQDIMID